MIADEILCEDEKHQRAWVLSDVTHAKELLFESSVASHVAVGEYHPRYSKMVCVRLEVKEYRGRTCLMASYQKSAESSSDISIWDDAHDLRMEVHLNGSSMFGIRAVAASILIRLLKWCSPLTVRIIQPNTDPIEDVCWRMAKYINTECVDPYCLLLDELRQIDPVLYREKVSAGNNLPEWR